MRIYTLQEKRLIVAVAMICFAVVYLFARLAGLAWSVWW